MSELSLNLLLLSFGFLLGFSTAYYLSTIRKSINSNNAVKPVYGIFGGEILNPELFKEYQDVAIPLSKEAGLEIIAYSEKPLLLEGSWPFDGGIAIERFNSLDELNSYRASKAYQAAKEIRNRAARTDFTIIIDNH